MQMTQNQEEVLTDQKTGDSTSWRNKPIGSYEDQPAGNANFVAVTEQPHAPGEDVGHSAGN